MKKIILAFFSVISLSLFAQLQGAGGTPKGFKQFREYKNIDHRIFSQPDIEALRAEDAEVDGKGIAPWRFGYNHYTQLNLNNAGTWLNLPNGDKIWQLVLTCENALTINLTFSETEIPAGNELYVFNPEKNFILGKFTAEHLYQGKLGCELIPGNTAVIEYYVPKNNKTGAIQVGVVTHGYRTAAEFSEKAFGSSGSCNFNVNCSVGANWTNQRNSVVMLVSGSSGFCSGALINNTANDGKPYVLTANHCYSDPTGWIFRFNWQAPDCNNPANEPSFQSLSGAVLRARNTPSDFCLVEITGGLENNSVPQSFQPYFSGWDNSGNAPSSACGIHHPSGDIKKISLENNTLISTTFGTCPADSHWGVTHWDTGVTEGGSSGSPLFDQNHRIVGQLHGGSSACGGNDLSDQYGKVSYSWNQPGSTNATQLKYWLDPNNAGAVFIDGYDPAVSNPVFVDAGLAAPQGVSGTFCGDQISPTVVLSNAGQNTLTSATIQYGFDGATNLTYNWTGSLPQWQTTSVTLPTATIASGNHTFAATVTNPNSSTDENSNNNGVSSTFTVVVGGQSVALNLTLDCYGSETSWEVTDSAQNVLYSNLGYSDNTEGLVVENWCLPLGCYTYTIHDAYGDGLDGGTFCSTNGSVDIQYAGNSLAGIATADANFGSQAVLNFCVTEVGLTTLDESAVLIYPNPAKTQINITSSLTEMNIELLDITGKKLQAIKAGSQAIINVSSLSSGTYFVRIQSNGGQLIRKIVVE